MTAGTAEPDQATGEPALRSPDAGAGGRRRPVRRLFARTVSGFWVLAAMVLIFGVAAPDTFPTGLTLETTLGDSAVTGLLALGMMLPLVTGIIDLSIANVAGFSMVTVSWLNVRHGMGALEAGVIAVGASTLFGVISAVLVTNLGINSLITTLGVGTVALGLTQLTADGGSITPEFPSGFVQLGRGDLLGVPLPFVYVVGIAAAMYYLLEYTTLGRRLQATGGNPVAARLAGIRVNRLQTGVLLASAFIGGFAGIVLATKIGVATDATTPALLLPTVAALFLGATQIKGAPNPWGTVLGVIILATGIKGLQLLGASPGVGELFSGAVLLIAVAISGKGGLRLS